MREFVGTVYDAIGTTYRSTRRPDPRIADAILRAVGNAQRIINVGAGTGSYEPADRSVVAVEPSWEMIRQRPKDAAPVVQVSPRHSRSPTERSIRRSRSLPSTIGQIGSVASTR